MQKRQNTSEMKFNIGCDKANKLAGSLQESPAGTPLIHQIHEGAGVRLSTSRYHILMTLQTFGLYLHKGDGSAHTSPAVQGDAVTPRAHGAVHWVACRVLAACRGEVGSVLGQLDVGRRACQRICRRRLCRQNQQVAAARIST